MQGLEPITLHMQYTMRVSSIRFDGIFYALPITVKLQNTMQVSAVKGELLSGEKNHFLFFVI
jgi:hypothetical protein